LNNSGKKSSSSASMQSAGDNAKQNQDSSGWITLGILTGLFIFGFLIWFLYSKFSKAR